MIGALEVVSFAVSTALMLIGLAAIAAVAAFWLGWYWE